MREKVGQGFLTYRLVGDVVDVAVEEGDLALLHHHVTGLGPEVGPRDELRSRGPANA